MKTSQFIDLLAADPKSQGVSLRSQFLLALSFGALISVVLFMASLGPRFDFAIAIHSPRFDLKFVDTLAMAFPSALLCWRLLRPDARVGSVALLFAAPFLLLGGAVVAELYVVPAEMWGTKLIGTNALHCLTIIPLLSIAPLFALLYAMRGGAPQIPHWPAVWRGPPRLGLPPRSTPPTAPTTRRCLSRVGIRWRQ